MRLCESPPGTPVSSKNTWLGKPVSLNCPLGVTMCVPCSGPVSIQGTPVLCTSWVESPSPLWISAEGRMNDGLFAKCHPTIFTDI